MENDGKAAALAESFKGELQNVSNGAVIVIGTGIGSGIILNGELYMGSNFQSGELSFMIESNSNSDKLMGLSYSGVEMIKQISKVLNLDSNNNGEKVFEFIRKKNPIALAHFEKYCDGIALLIHNVQVVLDLQTIVISGGISQQDIFLEQIIISKNKLLDKNPLIKKNLSTYKIVCSRMRNDANLIGAVHNFINSTNLNK